MSHFLDILRDLDERLDLPQPARGRVLLEVAADLDDLYVHHREHGLDADAARARALESVELSDEVVSQLAAVHCGPLRRMLDRMSSRSLKAWERVLLALAVAAVLHVAGWGARTGRMVDHAGAWAWPLYAMTLAVLVFAATTTYRLHVKQDHAVRGLRRGLAPLLRSSVGLAFWGFAASWCAVLVRLGGDVANATPPARHMLEWGLQSTALLQLALGPALLGAAAWFWLTLTVGRIEAHAAESLLAGAVTQGQAPTRIAKDTS